MLMSQRATSAALMGAPSAGRMPCEGGGVAQAASVTAASAAATTVRSGVNMRHLPVGGHRPADDRIVVVTGVRRVARDPLRAPRLHVALLVDGAALQHRSRSGPLPGEAEAHQALRTLFAGERGRGPRRAAVGGDVHAADAPGPAPGDAGD